MKGKSTDEKKTEYYYNSNYVMSFTRYFSYCHQCYNIFQLYALHRGK